MNSPETQLWGEDENKWHKHTCRKCGQVDDCNGNHCPKHENEYLCFYCENAPDEE